MSESSVLVAASGELGQEKPDRDLQLQVSRRVDWRFLLPDVDLPPTAYIGREDRDLLQALELFAPRLTILSPNKGLSASFHENGHGVFPLVVAKEPTVEELRHAARHVDDGGSVYVELSRRKHSHRGRRSVRSAVQAADELIRHGLVAPRVHWHWPSFAACQEMVPLRDRAAAECALRRRGTGFASRCKTLLALGLLRAGVLERIVPAVSILMARDVSRAKSGN